MVSVLLAACPFTGHLDPTVRLARALVEAGHDVRVLTGSRFRHRVEGAGAQFLPLPDGADLDERRMAEHFPDRAGLRGLAAAKHDMSRIFLDPLPGQLAALDAATAERPVDVVVAEPLFMGALGLLARPRAQRPAVVTLGIMPITLSSRHAPPGGPGLTPIPTPAGQLLHVGLGAALRGLAFRGVQRHAGEMLRRAGVGEPPAFFTEWPRLSEAIVQLSVPSLEFPRPDLEVPVFFVGSLGAGGGRDVELPDWWGDLDGTRPVVHVTQGTAANTDLSQLLLPTAETLADRDVLVVATTGGAPVGDLARRLPSNARVAEFLPYDRLLPRTDVMVTNGGYGGVLQALQHGIPLVVAGAQQDKADIAARVRWSGTGVTTATLTPNRRWIDNAVGKALYDNGIRATASRVGDELKAAPGAAGAVRVVEMVAAAQYLP